MSKCIGPIALLGSGETSLAGGRIFEAVSQRMDQPLRIAIMETPAGFELNSAMVAGRVGEFLRIRLQNFNPQIDIVPARKQGSSFSPDDPQILQPLLQATLIFMGPGSPTYTVRQLKGSLAWDVIRVRHHQGAALVFASAAVIAIGAYTVPVYEVYKVGEDVSAVPGLDLFRDFNLPLSFLPHWNNTEGGDDVDTSRCFIGIERFNQWSNLLPAGYTTIGLDEHTGIIFDFTSEKCSVIGVSSVTLLRSCNPQIFPAGVEFPLTELGNFQIHTIQQMEISSRAWEMTKHTPHLEISEDASREVNILLEKRMRARLQKNWQEADAIRQQIAALGWIVRDTPAGQKIAKQS